MKNKTYEQRKAARLGEQTARIVSAGMIVETGIAMRNISERRYE